MSSIEDKQKKIIWIAGLTVLTITLMIYFRYHPDRFGGIVENTQKNLLEFYTKNLQPIFGQNQLTKSEVFNFAAEGSLPLNPEKNKFLRVGSDPSGRHFYEIVNKNIRRQKYYSDYVNRNNLNENQKKELDSLLDSYEPDIYEAVFTNKKNALAVNKDLKDVLAALRVDLKRFDFSLPKFTRELNEENKSVLTDSLESIVKYLRSIDKNRFIIISPDTIMEAISKIDFSKFHELNSSRSKESFMENFDSNSPFGSLKFTYPADDSNDSLAGLRVSTDSGNIKIYFQSSKPNFTGHMNNLLKLNIADSSNGAVSLAFSADTSSGSFGLSVIKTDSDSSVSVNIQFNLNNLAELIGSGLSLMNNGTEQDPDVVEAKIDSLARAFKFMSVDSTKRYSKFKRLKKRIQKMKNKY
jgi:hypothetical protein